MAGLNQDKMKMMEDEMNRFEAEIALPVLQPPPPPPPESRQVIGVNTYNQVQQRLEEQQLLAISIDHKSVNNSTVPPPPPPVPPQPTLPMIRHHHIPGLHSQNHMGPPVGPMMGPPRPMGPGMIRGPMGVPMGPVHPMGPNPMQPPVMNPMGFPRPEGGFSNVPPPPPPPPPPMMVPHQVNQRSQFRNDSMPGMDLQPGYGPPMNQQMYMNPTNQIDQTQNPPVEKISLASAVLSATPKLYNKLESLKTKSDKTEGSKKKKKKNLNSEKGNDYSNPINEQNKASTLVGLKAKDMAEKVRASTIVSVGVVGQNGEETNASGGSKKKEKKPKKLIRMAGGQTWEDSSLTDWEEDDFRLFCGDLGNDVTDEILTRAFNKYTSFLKAKVIRDKRSNKTKGFGFVSFKDPQDFIKAMKEMNGRYVGSRPIKLRKSSWRNRNLDSVRKKEKEKAVLIGLLTGR